MHTRVYIEWALKNAKNVKKLILYETKRKIKKNIQNYTIKNYKCATHLP